MTHKIDHEAVGRIETFNASLRQQAKDALDQATVDNLTETLRLHANFVENGVDALKEAPNWFLVLLLDCGMVMMTDLLAEIYQERGLS